MRWNTQRRPSTSAAARPAFRHVMRSALHAALRPAIRCSSHRVLIYRGPTLSQLYAAFNRSYNVAVKLEKERNAPSRFQMLGTPEERDRRMRQDLERAYGPEALAAREAEALKESNRTPTAQQAPPQQPSHGATNKDIIQVPIPPRPPPRNPANETPIERLVNDLFGVR